MFYSFQSLFNVPRALIYASSFSILALIFTGCVTLQEAETRETRSLGDLIHYFYKCDLKPDEIQPTRFEAVRASDGCAMFIGGAKVEVYIYDIDDPIQKKKLEKIRKENSIMILAMKVPVAINRGMVMLTYSKHPKKAEIVRAFKRFPLDYKKENFDKKYTTSKEEKKNE